MVGERGDRTVEGGDLTLLENFNFNEGVNLAASWEVIINSEFERGSGKATLHIPPFISGQVVHMPSGSNCFKYHLAAIELNFADNKFVVEEFECDGIMKDQSLQPGVDISLNLTPASTNPVFILAGIRFYDKVAGKFNPINIGENALRIIDVFTP